MNFITDTVLKIAQLLNPPLWIASQLNTSTSLKASSDDEIHHRKWYFVSRLKFLISTKSNIA